MELGINRPRFDITVADKTFTLYMIPNLARYKAIEFFKRMTAVIDAARIEDPIARQKKMDDVSSDDEDVLLRDILSIILKANNYAFEQEWWDTYTDSEGQVEFVMLCLSQSAKTKKKLMQAVGL